jgi:outer membrane receptor protein involved in Fe transport
MKLGTHIALGAALAMAGAAPALAQEDLELTDIEVPTLVLEAGEGDVEGDGSDIDLANIVQSAARAVTTVQEAPAIVTVITAEEIAERHVRVLPELLDSVPGYLRTGVLHSQFPHNLARGQVQAALLLHDSISMFDPYLNVATVTQVQPMELIKRVEVITGPGGVLWGSNSLLGIINVITKDAEDVDGVEVGVAGGHGPGDREYTHGYVMYGDPELAGGKGKLLLHGSFKRYLGSAFSMPTHIFSAPLPQPNSNVFYGPLVTGQPAHSFLFTGFAKLTWGNTQVRAFVPYYERHQPLGFPGVVVVKDLPEDQRPECMNVDPDNPANASDGCADPLKRARNNQPNFYDRYVVVEHRTRTAGGRAGLSFKAYGQQFLRSFPQLQILQPLEGLLEGGLAFTYTLNVYRYGGAIDGDLEPRQDFRVLYGTEAFHEFAPNNTSRSRQAPGIEATFIAPYNLYRLPLPCPLELDPQGNTRRIEGCPLTFAFPSSRTVMGAYLAPQWRPTKKLILDVGGRVQVAPEQLGHNFYDPTTTFGASAVYNFARNWHAKANFAQGFRPPVFNNLNSNGDAVQLRGLPNLEVERTNAWQGEINARLFKNQRRIRELNFRLDYSYTQIKNLIQITGGQYRNSDDRGVHSAEFLSKLYVQGGHRFELGYTWLRVATADRGLMRVMPEHWFNLLGVFNVIDNKLVASTNLKVLGAMEDANRLVEHRDFRYCQPADEAMSLCRLGDIYDTTGQGRGFLVTRPSDLVLDRLPPHADLMLGLTWAATSSLVLNAQVFNTLNGRYYQPDAFFDYEPRLEFLPNPYEDFRAYLGATYTY